MQEIQVTAKILNQFPPVSTNRTKHKYEEKNPVYILPTAVPAFFRIFYNKMDKHKPVKLMGTSSEPKRSETSIKEGCGWCFVGISGFFSCSPQFPGFIERFSFLLGCSPNLQLLFALGIPDSSPPPKIPDFRGILSFPD